MPTRKAIRCSIKTYQMCGGEPLRSGEQKSRCRNRSPEFVWTEAQLSRVVFVLAQKLSSIWVWTWPWCCKPTYRFPDIFVSGTVLVPLLPFYRTLGHHSEVWASHIFAYVTSFQFHKSCCNLSSHSTYPILRPLDKLIAIRVRGI